MDITNEIDYTPEAKRFQDIWDLPMNPFQFFNADDYEEDQILSLYELDRAESAGVFEIQNSIIEGDFGTGKTMLLKAIYAYHYSQMLIDFATSNKCRVVPIYIKLSDLPKNGENIYSDIMLFIYENILNTHKEIIKFLQEGDWVSKFKRWLKRLSSKGEFAGDLRYLELKAESVREMISNKFLVENEAGYKWILKLKTAYDEYKEKELIKKDKASIKELNSLFDSYFASVCEHILLLIDEVDTLPSSVFEKTSDGLSVFQYLMNQFRTNRRYFYKIAVYPQKYATGQIEAARIGRKYKLGFEPLDLRDHQFEEARDFFYRILENYLSYYAKKKVKPEDYFYIEYPNQHGKYSKKNIEKIDDSPQGDALEQLVYGSLGTVRRLIKFAGESMLEFIEKERKLGKVSKFDVFDCMRKYGKELINNLDLHSRILVDKISEECRYNKTFRFRAPNNEEMLMTRIYDIHKQDNIFLPIIDQDRWGRNFIFEFDYCYCVFINLPTHILKKDTKEASTQRSIINGKWIVQPEDLEESWFRTGIRMEGVISEYSKESGEGTITIKNGKAINFMGKNVFIPSKMNLEVGAHVVFRIESGAVGIFATDIIIIFDSRK